MPPRLTVRDVIRLLEADGWYLVATKGSHRQYKHKIKAGRVTVAGKPSEEVAPGTLNSILKQSGLKER
ncbi:type II toxin-antitoxin system HicA family toxin [Mesorhizobium sp. CU2]|uniref:type II toxin-antitoxin system HicA family toxin n=1 Tax=unclassified Mesorhizobium TaxID=325217 RepID=UPI00112DA86C|nr:MULTISPECIES: type II toxin-antitoxin system HicA family toxin [unclassified Mesorhizobium]TPN88254.1 type II toxin-antitoxin system HicA family toxin [Mesorhizobium sp. CU3]TPO03550.1 type II toxin-antitoxin system HicA family toxin [Mesorhizobium sp. CU2]